MTGPEKLCLEWENLNLIVQKTHFDYLKCRTRLEEKKILKNVSGHIESGQLVAILGSSGAGKTSLLAAISKRYIGSIDGRILLNGETIGKETMTKLSCFVPQFDITINSLTPKEHLYFMGELKLDRRWTRAQKDQHIQRWLRRLGLQQLANTRISSLSGGERKRLNLATDLMTNPPLIFCDEPTTGLDSFSALSVVKGLQKLTQADSYGANSDGDGAENDDDGMALVDLPKAVLCSIHQPTSEIFQCFSHIILMYAGRSVFQGTKDDAITYFSSLGFHCPTLYNPADYYLRIISDSTDSEFDIGATNRPINLLKKSFEFKKLDRHLLRPIADERHQEHRPIWFQQIGVLLHRACLRSKPSWLQAVIAILMALAPYLIIAFAYRNVTNRTQASVQDIRGSFILIISEIVFSCSYYTLHVYPSQMPLLRREANERIYNFSAFYVAETIWQFQASAIRTIGLITVTYLIFGFYKGLKSYFQLAFTVALTTFTANAYGFMLTGLFDAGKELAPLFFQTFQILAGVFINLHNFPYLRYISVFFFANEAMTILYWYDITDIECPTHLNNSCYHNGAEVLDAFAYNTTIEDVFYDYLGLVCLGLIMNIFAFFGIRRFTRKTGYY